MNEWTPGPWKWWTSNSWRRLKRDDRGITQNVLEPFVARDGHPDCAIDDADMALIAAAPDLAEALEAARRQLVTLGGEPTVVDGELYGDTIQHAVLGVIDAALKKARGEA